jgi:putative endonuclease
MFHVYMLASRRNGTLYTGSTDDLLKRVWEHRTKARGGFTARHGVSRLVWFENHWSREAAFRRERQIKEWRRGWKLRLIEARNPTWRDLYEELIPGPITGPEPAAWVAPASAREGEEADFYGAAGFEDGVAGQEGLGVFEVVGGDADEAGDVGGGLGGVAGLIHAGALADRTAALEDAGFAQAGEVRLPVQPRAAGGVVVHQEDEVRHG